MPELLNPRGKVCSVAWKTAGLDNGCIITPNGSRAHTHTCTHAHVHTHACMHARAHTPTSLDVHKIPIRNWEERNSWEILTEWYTVLEDLWCLIYHDILEFLTRCKEQLKTENRKEMHFSNNSQDKLEAEKKTMKVAKYNVYESDDKRHPKKWLIIFNQTDAVIMNRGPHLTPSFTDNTAHQLSKLAVSPSIIQNTSNNRPPPFTIQDTMFPTQYYLTTRVVHYIIYNIL